MKKRRRSIKVYLRLIRFYFNYMKGLFNEIKGHKYRDLFKYNRV